MQFKERFDFCNFYIRNSAKSLQKPLYDETVAEDRVVDRVQVVAGRRQSHLIATLIAVQCVFGERQ